jgi:hypothetical protein
MIFAVHLIASLTSKKYLKFNNEGINCKIEKSINTSN